MAFRGTVAVAAGLVTPASCGDRATGGCSRTPTSGPTTADLALRSRAGYRYVEGRGVPAGYSAAELLGASCGPTDAPVEVLVPGGEQRDHDGLPVCRDRIAPGEIVEVDGSRGTARIAGVLSHADRRAGSPMETRLRLVLLRAGLPRPKVQWVVQDERARTAVWLDLAYPEHRIGLEYDGEVHAGPDAVLRDIGRHTALLDKGWRVYRYTKLDVLQRPGLIVDQIRRAVDRSREAAAVTHALRGCASRVRRVGP